MAIQYSKATKKSIDAAVSKARTTKPRVKILGFNSYQVTGSKGDVYTCSFTKDASGDFIGLCDCPANRKSKVCYHLAAVSSIYKQQVSDRAKARATSLEEETAAPTLPAEPTPDEPTTPAQACPDCGDTLDIGGYCWTCPLPEQRSQPDTTTSQDSLDLFGE